MQLLFRKEKNTHFYNVYMSDGQGMKCHTRIPESVLIDPEFNAVVFLMEIFEEAKALSLSK